MKMVVFYKEKSAQEQTPWSAVPPHRFSMLASKKEAMLLHRRLYQSGAGAPHSKEVLVG